MCNTVRAMRMGLSVDGRDHRPGARKRVAPGPAKRRFRVKEKEIRTGFMHLERREDRPLPGLQTGRPTATIGQKINLKRFIQSWEAP